MWFQKWTLYFALAAIYVFLNDPIMHKSQAYRPFNTSNPWVIWKHNCNFLYTVSALFFLLTFWNIPCEWQCFDIHCHCVFSLSPSLLLPCKYLQECFLQDQGHYLVFPGSHIPHQPFVYFSFRGCHPVVGFPELLKAVEMIMVVTPATRALCSSFSFSFLSHLSTLTACFVSSWLDWISQIQIVGVCVEAGWKLRRFSASLSFGSLHR